MLYYTVSVSGCLTRYLGLTLIAILCKRDAWEIKSTIFVAYCLLSKDTAAPADVKMNVILHILGITMVAAMVAGMVA